MRKLFFVAVIALLVSGTAALAKERNVQLIGASTSPRAGQSWMAMIGVKMDGKLVPGKTPTLRVLSVSGRVINVASRATPRAGVYRVRVVFPTAGMWRVLVIDRMTGRAYEFGRVRVRAS